MLVNPANYSSISFPLLGIEINPIRYFTLGPLTIHLYGVVIAFGLLLAGIYCCRRSKYVGLTDDDILDGILWITPFAVICARIYYCVFSWADYASDPISVLYIWNGGLAIYGAVIGAVIGAAGFLIGQFIGRWGNFFNREAFGAPTMAFSRMGLFNTVTGQWEYYHPTFLYESLWNFCGFWLLHFLYPKRAYDGQIALGYCAWYGLGRAMIEGLRMDSLYWGSFRVSQVLAAVGCLVSLCVLTYRHFRPHDRAQLAEFRCAETLRQRLAAQKAKKEKKSGQEL